MILALINKYSKIFTLCLPLYLIPLNFTSAVNITQLKLESKQFSEPEEKDHQIFSKLNIPNLDLEVFKIAYKGYTRLSKEGKVKNNQLSIIDFSKSSALERMFVIDMEKMELKYQTLVTHGKSSGEEYADKFSNTLNSNKSSIGFYLTAETYSGKHGYSLKLDGMETSNNAARDRAIVMHSAAYATRDFITKHGRLGRSQGCPALPPNINKEVIDLIKEGSCLFIYYPCKNYLSSSDYLNS